MDEIKEEERAERIGAAFALLTAKLEDAAGLAVNGQAPAPEGKRREIARQVANRAEEAVIIAGALSALLTADLEGAPKRVCC